MVVRNPETGRRGDEGEAASGEGGSTENLAGRLRTGAILWTLGRVAARAIRVAVQLVLAWKLSETDFGLVGMTGAFIIFLQLLSEGGVGIAVIRKKNLGEDYAASAFWLNMGMSLALMVLIWAMAPWVARFYRNEAVTDLLRVSAVGFPVTALRTIPMALMRQRMQFGRFAGADTIQQAAQSVLTIAMALAGARYWSMVVPPLVVGAAFAPVWWRLTRWHPRFRMHLAHLNEIFHFGKYVLATHVMCIVMNNAGFIIAGRLYGDSIAGLYKFAVENSMFFVYNIAWVIANTSLSGFVALQNDPARFRSLHCRVFDLIAGVTIPIHLMLLAQAPVVFAAVFPPRWDPAIPIFRILMLLSTTYALRSHIPMLFDSTNRPHVNFYQALAGVLLVVPSMVIGCMHFGLTGLAAAACAGNMVWVFGLLMLTPRLLGWKEPAHHLRRSVPFIVGGLLAAAAARGGSLWLGKHGLPALPNVMLTSSLGGLLFPAFLYVFARGTLEMMIRGLAPEKLRRLGRPVFQRLHLAVEG